MRKNMTISLEYLSNTSVLQFVKPKYLLKLERVLKCILRSDRQEVILFQDADLRPEIHIISVASSDAFLRFVCCGACLLLANRCVLVTFCRIRLALIYAGMLATPPAASDIVETGTLLYVDKHNYLGEQKKLVSSSVQVTFFREENVVWFEGKGGSNRMSETILASSCIFNPDPSSFTYKFWIDYIDSKNPINPVLYMLIFPHPKKDYDMFMDTAMSKLTHIHTTFTKNLFT